MQYLELEALMNLFIYVNCSSEKIVLVFSSKEFVLKKRNDEKINDHHDIDQIISRVLDKEFESRVSYESFYKS